MKLSLLVSADPANGGAAQQALAFSQVLANSEHDLYRVFFYRAGVLAAVQGKGDLAEQWAALSLKDIDLCVCPASAQDYGVALHSDSEDSAMVIHPGFSIGGLAQLVDASVQSHRVVSFC